MGKTVERLNQTTNQVVCLELHTSVTPENLRHILTKVEGENAVLFERKEGVREYLLAKRVLHGVHYLKMHTAIYVALGLVAIYMFFTDARFMLAFAVLSIALYVLERVGAIKQGPVTDLARYFLAVSFFIAIPIGLIFLFGQ